MKSPKRKIAVFLAAAIPLSIGGAWFMTGPAEATDNGKVWVCEWTPSGQLISNKPTERNANAVNWDRAVKVATNAVDCTTVPPPPVVTTTTTPPVTTTTTRETTTTTEPVTTTETPTEDPTPEPSETTTEPSDSNTTPPAEPFAFSGVTSYCGPDNLPEIAFTFPDRPDLDGVPGQLTYSDGSIGQTLIFQSGVTRTVAYPASHTSPLDLTFTIAGEVATGTVTLPENCPPVTTTTTTPPVTTTTTTTPPVTTTTTTVPPTTTTVPVTTPPVTTTTATVPPTTVTTTTTSTQPVVVTTPPSKPKPPVTKHPKPKPNKPRGELSHTGTNETPWQNVLGLGLAAWALFLGLVLFAGRGWQQGKAKYGYNRP